GDQSRHPAQETQGVGPGAMIRRALLSVSDKTGIVELARALRERGVQLLSTGGTAKLLEENGIAVTEVSSHTGFPEIMGGRVKTLHPRIHGGLLGRRGIDDEVMRTHGIEPIDLLVVNLYPFAQTIARPRSEEHTSELQSRENLVCRLLLEKKKRKHEKSGTT